MIQNGPFLFPLNIISDIDSLSIDSGATLRRITEKEVEELFGITNRQFYENNTLKSWSPANKPCFYPFDTIFNHVVANTDFIFASNYILVSSEENVEKFNQALKLFYPGKSGTLIGFNTVQKSIHFNYPNPNYKKLELIKIDSKDQDELIEIYSKVKGLTGDEKFELLIELYLNALSGNGLRKETRFIDLCTILEILYLGSENNAELNFRLCLHVAKVFSKFHDMNPSDTFKDLKELYNVRSKIIHVGKSDALSDETLKKMIEYARRSLRSFINNPSIFKPENLTKLTLE